MMQNSEASKWSSYWNSMFLSVDYWIFYSVSCPHLIQIQKIILVIFWNSINLWAIWWEYVCYGHHLIEFHCKHCNPCEILGFETCSSILANWGSIHIIELSNLDFKMVVLLNTVCHFCLSLPSIYVVHKSCLSLITLMNFFSKFFKMALVPPS